MEKVRDNKDTVQSMSFNQGRVRMSRNGVLVVFMQDADYNKLKETKSSYRVIEATVAAVSMILLIYGQDRACMLLLILIML